MFKIMTPATSANLGVGFDSLALAFEIYNSFTFEASNVNQVIGFDEPYNNLDNLVYKSYIYTCKEYMSEKKVTNVSITLLKQEIPVSRGLGSSASCILAGVLGANLVNKLDLTLIECANIASRIEGHYDNVFGCAFGGLTSSYSTNDSIKFDTFVINKDLQFTLLIPGTASPTKEMRDRLPKSISVSDAVYHLSRMIHIPKAVKNADIKTLKELLKDTFHENIRYDYIPMKKNIQRLSNLDDVVVTISGSGPTILVIHKNDISKELEVFKNTFRIVQPEVSSGVKTEVI